MQDIVLRINNMNLRSVFVVPIYFFIDGLCFQKDNYPEIKKYYKIKSDTGLIKLQIIMKI